MKAYSEIVNFNEYRQKRRAYFEKERDYKHLEGYDIYEENPHIFLKKQLDEFLISTARVSKIFWPIRKKYKSRGERLRKMFSVKDNHILKNRSLRDAIEHNDEKLDDWLEQKSAFKINYSIGDKPPNIVYLGPSTQDLKIDDHILYHFDRLGLKFYFRNQIFDIKKMNDGVEEILTKITKFEGF